MWRKAVLYSSILMCMALGLSCDTTNSSRVTGGPGPYIGNLHTHTIASDGVNTYHDMVKEADKIGLDFLVITDHHTISPAVRMFCPGEERLLCVKGEEISAKEGHIVAIDIYDVIPAGLSAQETIDLIHAQGGIAIAAHLNEPHGWGINSTDLEKLAGLDAVEYTPIDQRDWYAEINPPEGYPLVYDSDAHSVEMLKDVANRCELSELSVDGLKQAIKEGKCEVYYP